MFSGCGNSIIVPSEQELIASGHSLKQALPDFTELEDNYTYRQKVWQTNGEDSFYYNLVKLDDGDIYSQTRYYYGNSGWQIEDDAFTFDSVNKSYTVYAKQNENYTIYRKFKYSDQDEEFTKYSYSYDLSANNIEASNYYFDYSFFQEDMFEYYEEYDQDNDLITVWRVKSTKLLDTTFKTNILSSFNRSIESVNNDRIDFIYFYVTDNKVSKIIFEYWNETLQHHYRIETQFSYDDYVFDLSNLTSGFVPYIEE